MNRKSFEHLLEHFKDVNEYSHPNVCRVLVGTCADLNNNNERVVTYNEAKELAEQYGVEYFEISAKTGKNVNECFQKMIEDICDAYDNGLLPYKTDLDYFELKVGEDSKDNNNRRLCCNMI